MQGLLISLALKYALSQLAETGAATNWQQVKTTFNLWAKSLNWGDFMTHEMTVVGDALIDDIAKACQDTAAVQTVVEKLVAKDLPGAEGALKVLVGHVAGANPYVAALLQAA